MHDPFLKLEENASRLGKHNLKYIYTISKYKDELISALERNDSLDKIHLWNRAKDFSEEMNTIADMGDTLEDKLNFLACYYAIQFMLMNTKATDALSMALVTSKAHQRLDIYKDFMRRAGVKFRQITGSYMKKLLDLFMDGEDMPEFVICSVGARADQDDIDVGIITKEASVSKNFGNAISKLNKQMFIHATRLHFHLSEMLGIGRYYSTIEEYWDYLRHNTNDFVFITEIIGACKIFGSDELFERFKKEIVYRYFYKPGRDNKYHEAYLRGMLGEIRSLVMRKPRGDNLNPKADAIRMLKGFIYVAKTIWNIEEVNAWDIVDRIREDYPEYKGLYGHLDMALTSTEFFRYIYQLFVVQEEGIPLDETYEINNIDRIATFLGYEENPTIKPWHYIVHEYHEQVKKAQEIAEVLFHNLKFHLKSVSVFSVLLDKVEKKSKSKNNKKLNIAIEFVRLSRFFRGNTFWDDILNAISEPDSNLLKRFIQDLQKLSPWKRRVIIKGYVVLGEYCFYPLFWIFRTLIKEGEKFGGHEIFLEFNKIFLEELSHFNDVTNRIVELFDEYPGLINDYLMATDMNDIPSFEEAVKGETDDEQNKKMLQKLLHLCQLYHSTSVYFKGFFPAVFERYPECIKYLDSSEKLKDISMGLFGEIEDKELISEKKLALASYYNLEFVRVSLETLRGIPLETINNEFTEFSDNYFKTLFVLCKEAVEEQVGDKIKTDDLVGIYAAGGHAREQAYDDDFDVIVILNSTDEKLKKLITKIVIKMNRHIMNRGMLAHYRFAEHFGNYVTMLTELEDYFKEDREESFIDKSQLLGSRLIVGSRKMEKKFINRIIKPYVFEQSEKFINQMVCDMKSRHDTVHPFIKESINLKECPGGLRDIEAFLFIAKARFGIRENISENLFNVLFHIKKEYRDKIISLKEHYYFLKKLRDVYRLTVGADDELTEDYLRYVVKFAGYNKTGDPSQDAKRLYNEFKQRAVKIYEIIEYLLTFMIAVGSGEK